MTLELTECKGSYVNRLIENKVYIERLYNSPKVSTAEFRAEVRRIVLTTNDKKIEDKSEATKRFLSFLNKVKTKTDILSLVWNATLKGDGLGVL